MESAVSSIGPNGHLTNVKQRHSARGGRINDPCHRVKVVLDAAMMAEELMNFLPLSNAMTTTLKTDDFRRFLRSTGHEPIVVMLPLSPPVEFPG